MLISINVNVITTYPNYENDRKKLLDYVTEAFPLFEQHDGLNKFIFIIHDWEATQALSEMLSSVQKVRGLL